MYPLSKSIKNSLTVFRSESALIQCQCTQPEPLDFPLIFYRGESHLPSQEFQYMQNNVGGLVSTNAFCSTSKSKDVAMIYAGGGEGKDSEEFKVVLFEITVHKTQYKSVTFVDIEQCVISNQSVCGSEQEILFTIGSVFRIDGVERDEDLKVWKICMTATDETFPQLNEQIRLVKLRYENEKNSNLLFGRYLIDNGHYAKAEAYFRLMLQIDESPYVFDYLGNLYMCITNWQEAQKKYERALQMKTDPRDLAVTYVSLGNYYRAIQQYDKASECYMKALKYWNKEKDQINIAITQLNLISIHSKCANDYSVEEDIDSCLKIHDLLEQQIQEPRLYVEIIYCQNLLGERYSTKVNYEKAEEFYLAAFEITKQFLSIGNSYQIRCIRTLSNLYQKVDENNMRALSFCNEELKIHENRLPENHLSIAHLLMLRAELVTSVDDRFTLYERALSIIQCQDYIEYQTMANCFLAIGDCYNKKDIYNKSVKYYRKAYDIQKKIYPPDHVALLSTNNLIDSAEKDNIDTQ
ncbi:unnamed protein product [Didymodactylos carnosus]|uniref:Tetratricopeptide repeat protein n=1 Tax=Didymodactylos carnosus TaxID=1234261 RepID=A0A815FHK2_9BILA|nr:unnamed protein product [Didymodactylos carnosus]CAF4180550.1 unnamed protein product [Didymodactylos carnosus]